MELKFQGFEISENWRNGMDWTQLGFEGTALPLDHGGGPGEAGAEDDHEDEVAALDAAGLDGFVEGNRDGCGGGVAVFVEIDE